VLHKNAGGGRAGGGGKKKMIQKEDRARSGGKNLGEYDEPRDFYYEMKGLASEKSKRIAGQGNWGNGEGKSATEKGLRQRPKKVCRRVSEGSSQLRLLNDKTILILPQVSGMEVEKKVKKKTKGGSHAQKKW